LTLSNNQKFVEFLTGIYLELWEGQGVKGQRDRGTELNKLRNSELRNSELRN
jgi:hypothetical protein